MANKNQSSTVKSYTADLMPNHKIGTEIKFVAGRFSTADSKKQKMIESDPMFGIKIFEAEGRNEEEEGE